MYVYDPYTLWLLLLNFSFRIKPHPLLHYRHTNILICIMDTKLNYVTMKCLIKEYRFTYYFCEAETTQTLYCSLYSAQRGSAREVFFCRELH